MTQQASIDEVVARIVKEYGHIDILVNNAGVFDLAPTVEITRESYQRVFSINVEGLLFTLQAVARQMIAQGRGGKIINLASQAGRRVSLWSRSTVASKAAVISITQSTGLDLIKHGINVNAVAPGVVDGEHWMMLIVVLRNMKIGNREKRRSLSVRLCYWAHGAPGGVERPIVFLASRDADYIVAQTYNIDGGNWMS